MGESLSWIAVRGIAKEEILSRLALDDSGEPVEPFETSFAGAELPNGWYVVVADEFDWLDADVLQDVSAGCRAVGYQVMDTVSMALAYGFEDGRSVWEVRHFGAEDVYDLGVDGTPPDGFEALRATCFKEQDTRGGRSAGVDCIAGLPADTVALICGYRHDVVPDEGELPYTGLDPV